MQLRNPSGAPPATALSFTAPCFRMASIGTTLPRRRHMAANWIVRHGAMRFLGEFDAEGSDYTRGAEVVVRTERGLELGQVLCEATPRTVQMLTEPTHGRLVRVLSDQDRAERDRLAEAEGRELETCGRFVAERRLQMELVDV